MLACSLSGAGCGEPAETSWPGAGYPAPGPTAPLTVADTVGGMRGTAKRPPEGEKRSWNQRQMARCRHTWNVELQLGTRSASPENADPLPSLQAILGCTSSAEAGYLAEPRRAARRPWKVHGSGRGLFHGLPTGQRPGAATGVLEDLRCSDEHCGVVHTCRLTMLDSDNGRTAVRDRTAMHAAGVLRRAPEFTIPRLLLLSLEPGLLRSWAWMLSITHQRLWSTADLKDCLHWWW